MNGKQYVESVLEKVESRNKGEKILNKYEIH